MATWAHHTRKQTGEAPRRRAPIRPEVCKSCKLIPSLLPSEGSVHKKKRKQFPVQRNVKEHEVPSADKTTFPKRTNRRGNNFNGKT